MYSVIFFTVYLLAFPFAIVVNERRRLENANIPLIPRIPHDMCNPNTERFANNRYVVLSCKIPRGLTDKYFFMLPLTVRAWRRVHYKSVVIFSGNVTALRTQPGMIFVHQQLIDLDTKKVLLEDRSNVYTALLISQVSRLFASMLVGWNDLDNVFLMISDVNMWPVNAGGYEVPYGKNILNLNSDFGEHFIHDNETYTMYPSCNIGMTTKLWKTFMRINRFYIQNSDDVNDYMTVEFPALNRKFARPELLLDQRLLGVRIARWIERHGESCISFRSRNLSTDRLDRVRWHVPDNLKDIIDARVFRHLYNQRAWDKVKPLIKLMFSDTEVQAFEDYRNYYLKLLWLSSGVRRLE